MTDSPLQSTDSLRFQEACDWFVRLREAPESPDLIAGWLAWCHGDPRNREAFEDARDMWVTMGLPTADAVKAGAVKAGAVKIGAGHDGTRSSESEAAGSGDAALGASSSSARVAPHTPGLTRVPSPRSRRLAAAAAVAAILAGAGWLMLYGPFSAEGSVDEKTFTTARSERRSFMLADGSSVEMAGDSTVRARLGAHNRDIELHGEAYFSVAHDKLRPFVVRAGALHVRAVGTRFDVRAADNRVVVAVEEGVVVVEPPPAPTGAINSMLSTFRAFEGDTRHVSRLRPMNVRSGQEVAVGVPDNDLQMIPIEPTAVASWRAGRLRFAREPLRSVISSIRAASGQDIELTDPELGELRFTGTVFSSHVDAWVHALPAVFPVTVHQDGARIVIAPRVEPRS